MIGFFYGLPDYIIPLKQVRGKTQLAREFLNFFGYRRQIKGESL